MSSRLPTVDAIVSTFDEERFVGRCLQAVLSQDYPAELLRVWLVDGGSSDATVSAARELAATDPRLTVIADGVRRNLPEALNVALDLSTAELVAKIDAHGYPEPDFVRHAVELLLAEGPDVGCVGGQPVQEGNTQFGSALALARGSRFGVGGSVYAMRESGRLVDTVQCGVYRRSALAEVGLFDPSLVAGEDEELNWRLRLAGYRIVLDTRIRFHYVTRSSWAAAYRQYRAYGRARVRVIALHPGFLRARHLAPPALVAGLAATGLAAPVAPHARRGLSVLLGAYALGAIVAGARVAAGAHKRAAGAGRVSAGWVSAAFVALHLGYGVGVLRGLAELAGRVVRDGGGGGGQA